MKKFSHATSPRTVSTVLLAVIVSALCFSVGEGLRLTPFPVSAQTQDAGAAVSSALNEISLSQYGPLDVPAQTQKRSKRHTIDFAATGSPAHRDAVTESSFFQADKAIDVASVMFVAPPSGRAPPFLS